MTWRGPFKVIENVFENNTKVIINEKERIYHVNLLKKYLTRVEIVNEKQLKHEPETSRITMNANANVIIDNEEEDTEMIKCVEVQGKEDWTNVNINENLSKGKNVELEGIIKWYEQTFTDSPGYSNVTEHKINVVTNEPVYSKSYQMPFRQEVRDEIEKMLETGVIRKSDSAYASPIVVVKKNDKTKRICVDYRKLNAITVFDPEPMTAADDILQQLSSSKYFSKLDMTKGYWQIAVNEEDIHKTAFVSPDGHYEWIRMTFGLINAGATLVRAMRQVLRGLDGVTFYMDDIIIFSNTREENKETVRQVLQRFSQHDITLRPSKCSFGENKIEFIVHVIDNGTKFKTPRDKERGTELPRPYRIL